MSTFPPQLLSLPLGTAEEAKFVESRLKVVNQYRCVAILMFVCAILSIIVGVVILAESKGGSFPILSGSPLWSGLLVLVAACFGLALGSTQSKWNTESDRSKQRCLVMAFYVLCVTSCSFCGLSVVYTIWGSVECGKKSTEKCGRHYQIETIMNILGSLLAALLLTSCIIVSIMFCCYRKYFQFYSTNDRLEQMQRMIISQQQQLALQSQGHPVQATQYSTIHSYGTNLPVVSPPEYTEKPYRVS